MQLYGSRNNHFLYIITFLDSLLEELQELPTLKEIVSFGIGPKYIISDYNQGHIIWELRTRGSMRILQLLRVLGSNSLTRSENDWTIVLLL
jgi:hypothetical protein